MLGDSLHNELFNHNPRLDTDKDAVPDEDASATTTRPLGLEDHAPSSEISQAGFLHVRAHTTDGYIGQADPLRNSAATIANGEGVTRPQLTRMLSDFERKGPGYKMNNSEVQSAEQTSSSELESPTNTKKVIIHDVMPTDTLAGVALRYGVSMASLRKANHLWATDSIHLRRQLYIPLEHTPFHKEADMGDGVTHRVSQDSSALNLWDVPASELSFFPSTGSKSPVATGPRRFLQPSGSQSHTNTGPRRTKFEESPLPTGSLVPSDHPISKLPPRRLSSIFSATRDTLDRLARNSTESNGTSLGKSNSAAEEHEQEHELDLFKGSVQDASEQEAITTFRVSWFLHTLGRN
ncbi:carbohydrate-binding module family 50 protein [Neolentinus lepideus HHB14362 ss-1]|uniref:Carbohydrate-binding module family 50 protein n=1 Tax=Neolentinus lepideus HHB14362 ss-1 TaxID=1314782 RepID=A0A165V515_9AGAM|nr:carbohydrate-binding module family 50 protein [Neolentinus lepideus HHB14362 ss-1]